MEFSNWDETCCGLLCQHPCCWSSMNRIERSIPRKATSIVKLDAVNSDNSRDEEHDKEKEGGKGRKGGNVYDGGLIITGPPVCDLFKSFPLCSKPLIPIDANSEKRLNNYALYTDIDSQDSLRFQVPRCPPGSEERFSIQSSEENKVPGVHIVQAIIINEDSNRMSKPQYVWIPAKKKEIKESVISGGQRPSTQIFEASQVLECNKTQRKKSLADVCDDWTTWMSSSKFRYKTNKCRYKPVAGVERQKTISPDLGFKFFPGSSHPGVSGHLVGRKLAKGGSLQTRGLSADSRIFWKLTSIIGSATDKRCPFTLESSQASSPDGSFCNGSYNLQKRSKTEIGTKNNESVKIPTLEVAQGKLATISLELGSKDIHPIAQPMNYQKKGAEFSWHLISSSTGDLEMDLKDHKEYLNKASSGEERREESKDEPGTIFGCKHENAVVTKDCRSRKKEQFENGTKSTSQVARRVSFIETIDAFDPQNWCHIEAMPLQRVRIPNAQIASSRKQPVCSGRKTHGHVSSKIRSAAILTNHQRVTPSPPNEQLEAIPTQKVGKNGKNGKNESTARVDFQELPKPPPPSPQMLSNSNRGPSHHELFCPTRSESVNLLEKPQTVSYLGPAEICKPWP